MALAQSDSSMRSQMKFDVGLVRDKNRHIWPLVYKHKTNEYRDLQLFFTIYRNYQSYAGGTRHTHFLPLYWNDSSAVRKDLRIGTLYYPSLFRLINDTTYQSRSYRFVELAPEIQFLNITKSKTGLFTQNNLFFFIWSKNDVLNHKSNLVVFPLYWYYDRPYQTTHTFLPVYRSVKVKQYNERRFAFYPGLYFYRRHDATVRHSLALLFYTQKYKRFNSIKPGRKTVLFPVFFSKNDDLFRKFTLLPLVHYDRIKDDKEKKSNLVLTPLFWHQKTDSSNRNVLFPVYWQLKNTQTSDSFRRTFVVPIYYSAVSHKLNQKYYIPLVWYKSSPSETSLSVVPLYFAKQAKDQRYSALVPFYFSQYNNVRKSKTIAITPLYWQRNAEGFKSRFVLPFYYYPKDGFAQIQGLIPIWFQKQKFELKDTIHSSLLLPIYYQRKSKNEKSTVLFPIYYANRYNNHTWHEKMVTVFPVYYKNEVENRSSTLGITPLFWSYHLTDSALKCVDDRHCLFPIWWQKSVMSPRDSIQSNTIFPLYFSKTENSYTHQVLFPILWNYKDSTYNSLTVFPFYHGYTLADGQYELNAYSPFVWVTRSQNKNKVVFFPLVWTDRIQLKNDTLRNTVVFPIYWKHSGLYHENITLFPVWWYKSTSLKGVTTESNTFFPLYFSKTAGDYKHKVLFPLVWKYQDTSYRSLTVFPFYRSYALMNGSYRFKAYTPLVWSAKSPLENKFTVFPLWWRNTDFLNRTQSTLLLPLGYYKTDSSGDHTTIVVTPLYWYSKQKSNTKNLLFPLWYRNKDTNYLTTYFFPSFYYHKDVSQVKFNVYPLIFTFRNQAEQSKLFFPLYYHNTFRKEDRVNTVTMFSPLVWIDSENSKEGQEKTFRVLPLYWHKYRNYNGTVKTNNTLFPIYFDGVVHDSSTVTRRAHVVFPIVWYIRNKKTQSFTLFPLYHHNRNSVSNNLAITPLFWSIDNSKKEQNLLWPLYNYRHSKTSNDTKFNIAYILYRYQNKNNIKSWNFAWPLIQRIKGDNYSYFHIAPIVWYKKSAGMNYFSIQPLFFNQRTHDFKRFQLLWQLYGYKNTFNVKTTNSFLFYTYYTTHFANGDYENRLLYKFYVNSQIDGDREKILLPFYAIENYKNGDYHKGYLLSLYQKNKTQIGETSQYYVEEKILWFIRLRSNFNYLKQKGIIRDRRELNRR